MALVCADDFASDCGEGSSEEAEEQEEESQPLERPLSDPRGDALRQKLQQKYQQNLQTELLDEYRRVFQLRLDKKFNGEELRRVQEVLQDAEDLLRTPGGTGKDNRDKKVVMVALKSFTDRSITYKSLFLPIEIVLTLPVDLLLFFVSVMYSKK